MYIHTYIAYKTPVRYIIPISQMSKQREIKITCPKSQLVEALMED